MPIELQAKHIQALNTVSDSSTQLGGGLGFSVILKKDGTVWTFGRNDAGQLGQNDRLDKSSPARIDPAYFNNEKVIKIEVSAMKTLALTESNNVYFWGDGTYKPVKIYSSSSPILDIDIGGYTDVNTHTAQHIVLNDGRVVSSGSNYPTQFGNGLKGYGSLGLCETTYSTSSDKFNSYALTSATFETCTNNSSLKKMVAGSETYLSNIVDISQDPNKRYVLALDKANALYIWGENKKEFATPLPNSSNLEIVKFEAATYPTFLTTSGELYYYPSINYNPVKIELENSTEKIIDIKSGDNNLLILGESGKVYALGPNNYGQIGNIVPSSGVDWNIKIAAYTGISNVISMGVGIEHTILQLGENNFVTLGKNSYGQLATTDVNSKDTFTKVSSLTNVKDIAATLYSSFAVTNDNKFYSWGGRNNNERLNRDGEATSPALVKDFSSLGNVIDLDADSGTFLHGHLLLDNGSDWIFGHNSYYSMGDPKNTTYGPYQLKNVNPDLATRTFNLKSSALGQFSGVALTRDNRVYSWGYDGYGMLGLGYLVTVMSAGVLVTGQLPSFNEVAADYNQTYEKVYGGYNKKFLLTTDGKVYAWGYNRNNQLGLSSDATIPTLVNTLPPIKQISMGSYHTLFLDVYGNVWSAGLNSQGQLGLGNTVSPTIPTKIPSLSNVKYIGTGSYSSYAILENGDLYSFGDNRYGQLGLSDLTQRNEPRKVPGITNPIEIQGGLKHAMLLTESGEIFVTGSDSDGQLGLSQSQTNSVPTTVAFPPNVSIYNTDNKIYSNIENLNVSGSVFSETEGVNLNLSYSIESKSGKVSNSFKSYTSTSTSEPYSFSLPLSSYNSGSYTLTVKATTDSGVSSQAAINFTIQDTTNPTISVDLATTPKWSLSPVTVNVTADDTGGSGYRGFRYAVTDTTELPTSWSSINQDHNKSISLDKSGMLYLHLQAYDNIGNLTYLRTGPYYIDLEPPEISFSEPAKWQSNKLNLGVNIREASAIKVKKWLPGQVTIDDIKNSGNPFDTSTLPITINGTYSFYVMDENNQESLETYTVSNINYTPVLHNVSTSLLVPYRLKSSFSVPASITHIDENDPTQLNTKIGSTIISSLNNVNKSINKKEVFWTFDYSELKENTLYESEMFLTDSRNGTSSSKNIELEIYNPKLALKSKLNGFNISWDKTTLSSNYRLLRDGEVVYTGTDNFYSDKNLELNETYNYTLEVLNNGIYVKCDSLSKNTGFNIFETASFINFPTQEIGENTFTTPSSTDQEYVKYQDLSDVNTPYSISVSVSDFASEYSSFKPTSFIFSNIEQVDETNHIQKVLSDINLSSTPSELIGKDNTLNNPYTKLILSKENIKLTIPEVLKLNMGSGETFRATIIWDVSYTP
ncbi:RCC1 domain-containing protein [Priestia aryabhattai]